MILGMVSFLRNTFYYRNYYDWKFIHVVLRVRVQYILGHVATSLTLFSLLSTWKENLRWWIITRNDSRYAINVASELQLHTGLYKFVWKHFNKYLLKSAEVWDIAQTKKLGPGDCLLYLSPIRSHFLGQFSSSSGCRYSSSFNMPKTDWSLSLISAILAGSLDSIISFYTWIKMFTIFAQSL